MIHTRSTTVPFKSCPWLTALAALLLGLLVGAGPARASGPESATSWSGLPIFGGEMTAIASDPSGPEVFYVGTRGAGVFKTTDLGDTWTPARNGLGPAAVSSLAVHPHSAELVLAGTEGEGVWRSVNGGASWGGTSGIYPAQDIASLVFDPVDPTIVFACGSTYSDGNIYRSTNGGSSWVVSDDGLPGSAGSHVDSVLTLAIDASDPDALYAGTATSGVYRSTDGGTNWSAVTAGLPGDGGSFSAVTAVTVSTHDQHAWAVVESFDGGLYRLDDGDTWQKVSADMELYGGDHLYIMPDDANIMFTAGMQAEKSTNGGVTWDWSLGHPDSGDVTELAYHPVLLTTLLAAGSQAMSSQRGGVFRTLNRGVTWDQATDGVTATSLTAVAVDPGNPDHLLVGTAGGGAMASSDGGSTWTWAYQALYPDSAYFGFDVPDMAIDPGDGQWVYLAANSLWASNDGGVSFSEISEGDWAQSIAIAPGDPSVVYVGTSFGNGIIRGTSSGAWAPANTGFPTCYSGFCDISVLVVDPTAANVVWAGTADGVVRTTDGGDSWSRRGLDGEDITAMAVNPGNGSQLIAATYFGRIYTSANAGASWQLRYQDLDTVTALVYDPGEPLWIYASTYGSGVLRSLDGGQNWSDFSAGVFNPITWDLALDTATLPRLYVATEHSGLYRHRLQAPGEIFVDDFESGTTSAWGGTVP